MTNIRLVLNFWGTNGVSFRLRGVYTIGYAITSRDFFLSFFVIRDLIGKIIPLGATSWYYLKVFRLLKKSSNIVRFERRTFLKIFFFSFIPLFCSLPTILADLNMVLQPYENRPAVSVINAVLRYFWDLVNLKIYLGLMRKRNSDGLIDESSLNESHL